MNNLVKARVTRVNRGQYVVSVNGREVTGMLSGKLQYQEIYPVIGDYVNVSEISDSEVLITDLLERTSYISRPDSGGHADGFIKTYVEQAMVANLDYLFIITSLNDDFSVNRIARFAATSIKGGCKPVIILTKADLCENKEEFLEQIHEMNSSMDAFCVSSYTGEGLDEVRKYLKPGVTIGLMGSSGVGKSTLINTLAGSEVMKVSGIREKDSKGRHTTTHREMVDINGTFFVDTPGMRNFGVCDVDEGIEQTFEDITGLLGCCRFSDCHHKTEPGCAIRTAIAEGVLTEERWNVYSALMAESNRTRYMSQQKKMAVQKLKAQKKLSAQDRSNKRY